MTKTLHKTLPGSHFCLFETKPCTDISYQISSGFFRSYLLHPLHASTQLSRILGKIDASVNRRFDHVKGKSSL